MTTIYVIKATAPNGKTFEKRTESPRLANYYFDECIADETTGYTDIEVYDSITGEPFQKYTITEDDEGDLVESIWTAREFYNLI
jgi:hypothetical protein